MLGYSRKKGEVFIFSKEPPQRVSPKIELETKLLRVSEVTAQQWSQLKQLQGKLAVFYLRFRYGSPDTYILLGFAKGKLVYVEWVVPSKKIRSRYPFVKENTYFIMSCLTSPDFRGLGIYPALIQKAVQSHINSKIYWGAAAPTNIPSLKGIYKAGGVKVGEFVQKKWFWGCISHIEYHPEESAGK
jgi:GNAT superfamily N-acetyltransferase